jgi:hypothetical protein
LASTQARFDELSAQEETSRQQKNRSSECTFSVKMLRQKDATIQIQNMLYIHECICTESAAPLYPTETAHAFLL